MTDFTGNLARGLSICTESIILEKANTQLGLTTVSSDFIFHPNIEAWFAHGSRGPLPRTLHLHSALQKNILIAYEAEIV
jgi:hypothetical protein